MKIARDFMPIVDVLIHHSPCNDGHASAALFYDQNPNIVMIGLHPKDTLLTRETCIIMQGKNVAFVDIAFTAEVMTEAAQFAKNILVLDHHVTNQTALQSLSLPNVHVVFVMGRAGVHLTWEFLHPDQDIPPALDYIGLKDVWKHENNRKALYFTTAFDTPQSWIGWKPFIDNYEDHVDAIIEKGRIVYDYQQSVLRTMMEKVQYTTWRGFRIAMVNVPFPWINDIGALMCEDDPINTIAVVWNKPASGPFSVSLRSHNPSGPNIETIAHEFKGGGHVHAAGLRLDVPPYTIFSDDGVYE